MARQRRTRLMTLIAILGTTATSFAGGVPGAVAVAAAASPVTGLYADGPGWPASSLPTNLGAAATWAVTVGADPSILVVNVSSNGDAWGFQFASAPGTSITTGSYTNAVRVAFRGPGQNGVEVSRNNYSCSTFTGSFSVLELTLDGSGMVTAAAVDYEIHCESQAPAVFGSIRYQSSVGYRAISIDPFPYPPPLVIGSAVPGASTERLVTVTSTGSLTLMISAVHTTGSDFGIASQDCTGGGLASGASCAIHVQFAPTAIGPSSGTLAIADNALAGGHEFGISGTGTAVALTPDPVDFGEVDEYTASKLVVTLKNGPNALTGISPSITTNHIGYDVVAKTCGTTLAGGASCTFTVRFQPIVVGTDTGVLWVDTNEQGRLGVNLTGVGRVGTHVAWGPSRTVALRRWNDGNAMAWSKVLTTGYLHAVGSSDVVGSRRVTDTGPYEPIYYNRSTTSGRTWTTAYRVNPTTQHGDRPTVAAYGSYVYVAWVSIRRPVHYSHTAPRTLYVRVNHAKGASTGWGTIHRITSTTGRVDFPVVAVAGSSVYLAWTDSATGSIRMAISRDRGTTWRTLTVGTTYRSTADGRSGAPSLSVRGSRIIVAWVGDPTGAIRARTSTNAGMSWTPVDTLAPASRGTVSASVMGARSVVVWATDRTVHVRTQTGTTWGTDTPFTPPGLTTWFSAVTFPSVAASGLSGIGVAYSACVAPCGSTSPLDLAWAESTDAGATWGTQIIGWNGYALGRLKVLPSVVAPTPALRYVMWNGIDAEVTPFGLYLRAGTGAP
jgi:hypothetical protein